MGVDIKQFRRNRWTRRFTLLVICALVGVLACTGMSGPQPSEGSAAASAVEAPAAASGSEAQDVTRLTTVTLDSSGQAATVTLTADGPLSWTSYQEEDALIVELANTVPASDLEAVETAGPVASPVERVVVETPEGEDLRVTRVRIATLDAVASDIQPEGQSLVVHLQGTVSSEETQTAKVSEEALAPAAPEAESIEVATVADEQVIETELDPATPTPVGTVEVPYVAPAPEGVPASQLSSLSVDVGEAETVVQLTGDGAFQYSTFRLQDPERLVLDLAGVVESVSRGRVKVEDGLIEQVRTAQFRSEPERVTRVVFDLESPARPTIESSADGLTLTFRREEAGIMNLAAATPLTEEITAPMTDEPEPIAPPSAGAPAEPPSASGPSAPEKAAERPVRVLRPEPVPTSNVELFEAADVQVEEEEASGDTVTARPPDTYSPETVSGGEKEYYGEPISLSLVDASIKDTLRSFAEISGLNMVVYPEVQGSVTVEMTNVPWDQALEQILKMNDLSYEIEGNIMRIAPISEFREEAEEAQRLAQAQALSIPLRTVIKRVSYATASEMASLLRSGAGGLLSQRGSVIVDDRSNTMIIRELPAYMDTVLAVIETLDQPEPQVRIEARIVETNTNFTRTLGIQWGFNAIASAATGNTTGLQFPNNVDAEGAVQLLEGGQNGLLNLSLGNVLNTFVLDATLQAAESEGLVNILSAPSITVLNNESAEIQSGLQIPIQTIANNTVSVQFVNATLRLQVTPHVTAEGTVLMDINIQKREPQLALTVPGATNAPIATKEARTRVIVRDGGTTVIGGIYEVSTDKGEDRVPGLANIPIIGHLFKNRTRTDQNEELLIFITPRVIKL